MVTQSEKILICILCFSLGLNSLSAQQTATENPGLWVNRIQSAAIQKMQGKSYHPARSGFALYFTSANGVKQPYLVYVPKSYTPGKAMPAVVFLHGAVLALDSFQYRDPTVANEPVFRVADSLNILVVFPFARRDFKWTDDDRVFNNIIAIVRDAQEHYHIDSRKIFIGGQSMGGNATFWFIKNHPEIFAGFYTFSALAHTGNLTGFENLTEKKPLFSLNARDDQVFSYNQAEKIYAQFKPDSGRWQFETVSSGGHRFIYQQHGEQFVYETLKRLILHGTK